MIPCRRKVIAFTGVEIYNTWTCELKLEREGATPLGAAIRHRNAARGFVRGYQGSAVGASACLPWRCGQAGSRSNPLVATGSGKSHSITAAGGDVSVRVRGSRPCALILPLRRRGS